MIANRFTSDLRPSCGFLPHAAMPTACLEPVTKRRSTFECVTLATNGCESFGRRSDVT